MSPVRAGKADIRAYWSALYRSAYADTDAALDRDSLLRLLGETEAMFRYREHLATTEMPIDRLAGLRVLEVGCGAGSHSALFAHHGAIVTALDLSEERVQATRRKFELLGADGRGCIALQGDAERLPFPDDCFDIVYSNGVLHHSPDTRAALAELRRVLKPGGRAVVMLYCRSSINWWVTLWLGHGIMKGRLLRGRDALGSDTEWAGGQGRTAENPVTRAYSRREIGAMFAGFENVQLRKSEFAIAHLPKIGKLWRWHLARRGAMHPGGMLPYGAPWPIATRFELWLGRHLGWAWNISAVKPPPATAAAH